MKQQRRDGEQGGRKCFWFEGEDTEAEIWEVDHGLTGRAPNYTVRVLEVGGGPH